MRKTEFLQELREALDGEVSASVIQSNISYYDQYISQEAAKGRREEEVIEEIAPTPDCENHYRQQRGRRGDRSGRFIHFGRRCRERAHSVLLQRRFFGAGRQRSAAELPLHRFEQMVLEGNCQRGGYRDLICAVCTGRRYFHHPDSSGGTDSSDLADLYIY